MWSLFVNFSNVTFTFEIRNHFPKQKWQLYQQVARQIDNMECISNLQLRNQAIQIKFWDTEMFHHYPPWRNHTRILKKGLIQTGWPSGLRRQIKALVSSGAWVRIPLQSNLFLKSTFPVDPRVRLFSICKNWRQDDSDKTAYVVYWKWTHGIVNLPRDKNMFHCSITSSSYYTQYNSSLFYNFRNRCKSESSTMKNPNFYFPIFKNIDWKSFFFYKGDRKWGWHP